MQRDTARMNWVVFLLGVSLVLGIGSIWLGIDNQRLRKSNQDLRVKETETRVALFFIKSTPTDFYLKPVIQKVKGTKDPHQLAIEALLVGPEPGQKVRGIFPKGSKMLGLSINNGTATLNLNRQTTRLNVGAAGESLAVAALVNTLTKFPDVYRVKLLIEGEEVESLAGHVDLTKTFDYNGQVVALE